MVENRLHTRLGVTLAAAAMGVLLLLAGCNGDSADDASGTASTAAASTVTVDGLVTPGPDAGRPLHGLPPWGASSSTTAGSGSNSSSSSGSAAPPGTVTIAWEPPTENTNGTALTNLAGFTIHYGTNSQNYTSTIQVANPGISRYVVDNLPPGTYYFAVSAYTSTGEDSSYSPQVSVTVD